MKQDNSYLAPLKKRISKRSFVSFDIETYGDDNDFYSVGFYDGEKFDYYYTKQEAIKHIENLDGKMFVATNLSFDLTGIYYPENWHKQNYVIRGGDIIISYYKEDKKKKFFDTMNYVKFSLAKLGKIIGEDKLKPPSYWKKDKEGNIIKVPKPKNEKEREELKVYNKKDCEVTYKFVEWLQKELNNLGTNLELTIAKTSLNHWRRNYQPFNLNRETGDIEEVRKLIYEAYFGGRTELFIQGEYELIYEDYNSLYPFTMLDNLPNPNTYFKPKKPSIKNISKYEGVSKVKIFVPKTFYPPVPYRKTISKTSSGKIIYKLVFPTGIIEGSYTHEELRYFEEVKCKILEVKDQICYRGVYPFFREFVKDLYNERQNKKGRSEELIFKLLMNSCYGKFSERPLSMQQFINDEEAEDLIDKGFKDQIKVYPDYCFFQEAEGDYKRYNFPIFSAYITSKGRIKLHKNISGSYYVDTDSHFTTKENKKSKELGGLKEEGRGLFTLVKPKFYSMKGQMINKKGEYEDVEFYKVKGFSKPNKEKFFKLIEGKELSYNKFVKIRESIIQRLKVRSKKKQKKKYKIVDDKRIWYGGFSIPLSIENR